MGTFIAALIVFLVVVDCGFGVNLMSSVHFSMATYVYLDDYQNYFTTVEHLNIEECAKLCHSVTSCKVGNYKRRGHICRLMHVLGDTKYQIGSQRRPNFISWLRESTDQVFTEDNSPCQNIPSDQSFMVNYDTGTCDSYACGKLPVTSSFYTLGNVFKTNGKVLTWTCYNHDVDIILPPKSITCDDDALWEGLDDSITGLSHNCTYSKHTMEDGSVFTYKVIDIRVNQTTALRKCRRDSANLVTILTLEKLEFYRGILATSSEDYWVDAERINLTAWRTSYGQNQPLGYDIWEQYDRGLNYNCARMRGARQYKLDDFLCSSWDYSYICERQLN